MAIELHHLHPSHDDELTRLKARIAELEKENAELKEQYRDMDVTHPVHIAKMNAKIEELEENVDFCKKENRRLKRALYKAIANWAHHRVFVRLYTNEKAWENVESKCRAKAEEYK